LHQQIKGFHLDKSLILKEISDRRSIRRYHSTVVESEKIELLLEAARLSPSACNLQPFRVLVVERKEDLEFVRKAAIALEHMVLQAVKLGLGTCWVHHFEIEEVREYFRIPERMIILTLIALGYPDENPKPRPRIKDIRYRA